MLHSSKTIEEKHAEKKLRKLERKQTTKKNSKFHSHQLIEIIILLTLRIKK